MKKLITLLLVLTGMVTTASAWSNLYLLCGANNWQQNDGYNFEKINENKFYYILDVNDLKTNNFIFRIKDTSNEWGAWSNEYELTSTEYAAQINEKGLGFKISSNAKAKFAYIFAEYKEYQSGDWRWHLSANIIEETTTVGFADIYDNWGNVKAYSWLSNGVKLLGNWPGTPMTSAENIYTLEVPYVSGATIKFTNKESGDNTGNESSEFTLEEDKIYKWDQKVTSVSASVTSVGYATFSTFYPLDFTDVTDFKAYRATISNGNVILKRITGKVPARTGLLLVNKEGAVNNASVPTCIYTEAADENYLVGTPKETAITYNNGYNYVLANQTPDGVGFYFVAENMNSEAGKAYLHTTTALNETGTGGSRASWSFEDETTGIADNNRETITNSSSFFNINGQRVAQPTKGLYIVNGKKVVVK